MYEDSITGRDGLVVCKALAYAIEAIGHLPKQWQEWSDREDMLKLLDVISNSDAERFRVGARSHFERRGVQVVADKLEVRDRDPAQIVMFPGV